MVQNLKLSFTIWTEGSEPKDGTLEPKTEKMLRWGLNCSYHYLAEMVKAVGWFGGDIPTSSKWFETKFPRILHGQRVLSQKMGPYNPKLSE